MSAPDTDVTALVTGAGRGLGLEFTRQLLERGASVIATARRPERSEGLAALAAAHGDRLRAVPLDVADPDSVAAMAAAVAEATDRLDLLINNAGINSAAVPPEQKNVRFGAVEPLGVLRMVQVNAVGPVLVTQALVELLAASPRARVVSVSSWLGSVGGKTRGGNYGYCTSKAALNMMNRAMAFDLAPRGIACVVVNPGWVQTDMGGPRASLTPAQSVAGLLSVADGLTPADAGRFLQWDGTEHPW